MVTASDVNINVNLPFPKAGVVISIKVEPPEGNGSAPSFHLSVTDSSGARAIPFSRDVSPSIADWVRGYSRWLHRARVSASLNESSIDGTFADGLSTEQVLDGVSIACDMIRQRFELYQESVLL